MIDSKLAHFSLVTHEGAVRAVVRFNDPARAKAAQKELGFGHVRAAQLSVGGGRLVDLYAEMAGDEDVRLMAAMLAYERTYPKIVGDAPDPAARQAAIEELERVYQEALREAGIDA